MSWVERLHPRDPGGEHGGEFIERGAVGWVERAARQISRSRVRGRDLLGELDLHAARHAPKSPHTYDAALSHIAHLQGFDGMPQVATEQEMDRAVAAGWHEMWRNVGNTDEEGVAHSEAYRTGQMWMGQGGYANGVYAMPTWRRASKSAYGNGELRIALHPDAKIIGIRDLYAEMKAAGVPTFVKGEDITDEEWVLSDAGRFAAARGYDAIAVRQQGMTNADPALEWVILNRTATMVQEADR